MNVRPGSCRPRLLVPALILLSRLGAAAFVLLALSASGHAQTYDQVAPKTPPLPPPPQLPDNPVLAAPERPAGDQVLVPALRGLVFLTNRDALQVQGVATEGLHVAGDALLETAEFRALATPYLGQPLSLHALDRLTRDVVLYFRQHGRPVVDVLVPEQNVSSGTVQILVIEGRLGRLRVEGNQWFSTGQILASVRARPGEVIEGAPLLADLAWINENAFREVDLVFTRGQDPGVTDIILRTHDRFPVRSYVGYEDSGNALTGFDRVLVGVNWGDVFGSEQQFNYQLSASPDFRKLVAHSGSYIIPIRALRHTLTLFGSYAESRPELANAIFALKGRTAQLSARYRVPLPAPDMWTQDFTAGLDFKRSNNNLSFGGTQVFAQENDVVQAIAAYGASHLDRHGAFSGEFTLALSPGGLSAGNHARAYAAARSFARPGYAYARLELERTTKLPAGFSWVVRGTAQLASTNLLGSEQLGLGGANSPRGYEEREANGDDGFILVNELHGPLLHLAPALKAGTAPDKFDPLVFVDYGWVESHERLPGEAAHLELASVGLGFRYQLGATLSARFDYGWQLKDSGVSDGRRSSRAHVSVTLAY
jgi:hemolysin activation/secretion protein